VSCGIPFPAFSWGGGAAGHKGASERLRFFNINNDIPATKLDLLLLL
jgi:hypothetical protein